MYQTRSLPGQPWAKLIQGLSCSVGLQPVLGIWEPARPLGKLGMATLTQPVVMLTQMLIPGVTEGSRAVGLGRVGDTPSAGAPAASALRLPLGM